MSTLGSVFRELLGLFVDDGALALEIVAVVVLAGMSAILISGGPLAAGSILLLGSLGVLFANVASAVQRR
jgi:2-keto-4-pentenoate hydratase